MTGKAPSVAFGDSSPAPQGSMGLLILPCEAGEVDRRESAETEGGL